MPKLPTKKSVHLFGHCHGAPSGVKGKAMDVGMDCNDLRPFALSDIQRLMSNIKKPKYDHHGTEL